MIPFGSREGSAQMKHVGLHLMSLWMKKIGGEKEKSQNIHYYILFFPLKIIIFMYFFNSLNILFNANANAILFMTLYYHKLIDNNTNIKSTIQEKIC